MILFDWIFSAWILSTIALMLLIFFLLLSIRRRLFNIERMQEIQDDKLFQLAMLSRPTLPSKPEEIQFKKGGWPKGKSRKKDERPTQ